MMSGRPLPSVSPKAIPMLASASPWPLTATPSRSATSSNVPSPRLRQTSVALGVIGDEPVDPAIAVNVRSQHAHASPANPPRLRRP